MRCILCVSAVSVVTALVTSASAQGATPIAHARVGNDTEGATLITAGPFAGQVALIDGYDVLAVPVEGRGRTAPQKLFDLKALDPVGNLSGIVYLPSERAYLIEDQGQPDTLFATDERGRSLPPRPITYLPDSPFVFEVEGMTYLPPGSPFPDRIARLAFVAPFGLPEIQVMTRAGVVEREIPLGPPLDAGDLYTPGLAYDRFTQTFIVSALRITTVAQPPAELFRVGLDGAVVSNPTVVPGGLPLDLEGLTQLRDGRVAAADSAAGELFAFNADLTRDAAGDRSFRIGLGVSRPVYGVFDPVTKRYALNGVLGNGFLEGVAEVSPSLDSASRLFGFDGVFEAHAGIAYLPEDDAFALGRVFGPPGIDIYRRDGSLLDSIDFAAVSGLPDRPVRLLAYVSTTRQFALRLAGLPTEVFLVSRTGTLDGSFPVADVPSSLQYASQGGHDRLLVWAPPALLTYDLAGELVSTQAPPFEGLVHPSIFIAGPGDDFALLDPEDSEVAVLAP